MILIQPFTYCFGWWAGIWVSHFIFTWSRLCPLNAEHNSEEEVSCCCCCCFLGVQTLLSFWFKNNSWGPTRWQRSKMWRSPSSPQIHQKYIYMWNNSSEHLLNAGRRPQTSQKARNSPCTCPCGWQGLGAPARCQTWASEWEGHVQDTGPPETSGSCVISISESSPRDLHLNAKTQLHSTISKLLCWTPHAKQLARQEHNPTH